MNGWRKADRPDRRWLGVAVAVMMAGGCGGPIAEDVASITGEPVPTAAVVALGSRTDISRISFQAGTEDLELEMFDEQGRCLINATTAIVALAGDVRGHPVAAGTPIAVFIERGRGVIEGQVLTDEAGLAEATFHSLCPANAFDPITILLAARGAEPFTDLNSNGRYDAGEPFVDLDVEAFLDANFNGVLEPELDEYLVWDPNRNGAFDPGGNGRYDTDTIIVARALILPTFKSSSTATLTPTATQTRAVATPTPSVAAATATASPPPTATPSHVPTATGTATRVATSTETATLPPTATATSTQTQVLTNTPSASPSATATEVPTATATGVPTETATASPPSTPTDTPTTAPSATESPSEVPAVPPTDTPTPTITEAVPTATPT